MVTATSIEELNIHIGDHYLQLIINSSRIKSLFLKNYSIMSAFHDLKPDVRIEIRDGYGLPFVNYDVEVINEANKIFFRRADYFIEVDRDYTYARISVHNELALKHALTNLYSSFIVHKNWGLLIHSSCAIQNEKAHMFAGQSGAGKSTAAALSRPRDILSDEATIVRIHSDQIDVFDSPFRSELEATHSAGTRYPVTLKSVQILRQAPYNKRMALTKSDGFLQLIDKVFYWTDGTPEETMKVLKLLKILINLVPVYELHFQRNPLFWELIS